MSLDYSKVIMVGSRYANRDKSGKLVMFDTAIEAAGGKKPVASKSSIGPADPKAVAKAIAKAEAAEKRAIDAEELLNTATEELEEAKSDVDRLTLELESVNEKLNAFEATGDGQEGALFDVFKVVDGVQADRASKHNQTQEQVDKFLAANPDSQYNVVADES